MDSPADKPVGSGNYVVQEGDCMNGIAYKSGFFWKTLWNLPENSELKSTRKNPSSLRPGDQVTIPDLRLKQESRATELQHRFKRKGVPAMLEVHFRKQGKPRAGERYVLEVDGAKVAEGNLGSDGDFGHSIPPDAESAIVRVGAGASQTIHRFALGTIPPVNCRFGLLRRLRNLGYFVSDDDPDSLGAALQRFQKNNGIDVTGKPDQATQDALVKIFGH